MREPLALLQGSWPLNARMQSKLELDRRPILHVLQRRHGMDASRLSCMWCLEVVAHMTTAVFHMQGCAPSPS